MFCYCLSHKEIEPSCTTHFIIYGNKKVNILFKVKYILLRFHNSIYAIINLALSRPRQFNDY